MLHCKGLWCVVPARTVSVCHAHLQAKSPVMAEEGAVLLQGIAEMQAQANRKLDSLLPATYVSNVCATLGT